MKKIFLPLLVFSLMLLLPSRILADVDIALDDASSTTQKEISLSIDTNTDTVATLSVSIQASTDVTITSIQQGTSTTCENFTSSVSDNVATVSCQMDTAQAVSGNIANILFTSTDDTYKFTVLQDSTLDISQLTLGSVVDIDKSTVTTTTTTSDTTDTTTATTTTTTSDTSSNSITSTIMNYLPYVLIGGAVILLFSIVGILISSRKKDPRQNPTLETLASTQPETPAVQESSSTPAEVTSTNPSIQDMINNNNMSTTAVDTPMPVQQSSYASPEVSVSQQEQSSDLEALKQEDPDSAPVSAPQEEVVPQSINAPESQPTQDVSSVGMESQPFQLPSTTPVESTPVEQQEPVTPLDMNDGLVNQPLSFTNTEVNSPMPSTPDSMPLGTDTTQPMQEPTTVPTVEENLMQQPPVTPIVSADEDNMPHPIETQPVQEIPTTQIPDLQQFINNQVSQVPDESTPVSTPMPDTQTPASPTI